MLWCGKDALNETQKRVDEEAFLLRLIHFENRYWSVSALLDEFGQSNVLEMSSGFSFRGLDKAIAAQNTVYTDTDLPDIVEMKKTLTRELLQRDGFDLRGKLFMQALNALDEAAFDQVLELFPPGPLTIVNEGLLVYLDEREKRHLLSIIHKVLKEKGGCWITGDVYIKTEREIGNAHDDFSDFLKKHNIDDNKFD
jgi:O-methyltransferase involved in polyketide biosynthesis